jgi:shikimate kinase
MRDAAEVFNGEKTACRAASFIIQSPTVNDARHIRNLTLVGFMGAGKSTVGRLAAEELQFHFVDTDHLIESRVGLSISDIFAQQGEAAFRQYEKEQVAELSARVGLVISAGGGLVLDPANMTSLKTHSLVACLWASPEAIWERVRNQSHRPLLQAPDPLAKIREMLATRGPAYRQADVLIHSGVRSPKEVALQLVHQFHLARKK